MIKVIVLGKIKKGYLKDAIDDYVKRIGKYSKIKLIELNDIDKPKGLEIESENILKYIDRDDYVISLCIEGKQMESEELSEMIRQKFITNPRITFVIGSSLGIHQEIKEKSNLKLSFSKMTFPHQMFRVMLLEQIYRSFKIINNEKYHK